MAAATNKADLLAVFDSELAKLRKTLDGLDEAAGARTAPGDTATVKGILAHRTQWIGLFLGWHADGAAGRTVHIPAEGYKWNELKAYNAPLYARGDSVPLSKLLAEFEAATARLRAFIEARDDAELYTPGVPAWTGKWTLGRYAESAGPAHFRSANAYIRKALRGGG